MTKVGESAIRGAQEALDYAKASLSLNLNSTDQLSLLLFGGKIKEVSKEPIRNADGSYDCIKAGENKGRIKYKNIKKERLIKGMGLRPLDEWKRTKVGFYNTDEEVLALISKKEDTDAGIFAKKLLRYRSISKEIATYFDSTLKLTTEKSYVHTQYVTVSIPTGRISSKYINMQNQPGSETSKVKQHFKSRYGKKGIIIQADYKQIEVIVFAFLCQDKTLQTLLINNKDIHRFIASSLYNKPEEEIDDKLRKETKPITFTITYGGGPGKVALQTGLPFDFCKQAIQTFYDLFPQAKVWHEYIIKEINYTGKLELFTGRVLKFNKYPSKYKWQLDKGILEAYNPSQGKDYPVQATAGDILFIMLGKLWRKSIKHRDKFLLVNTVHDSIIADCKLEYKDFACNLIKSTLDKWNEVVYTKWKVKWDLPTVVELSIGESWYDCK